MKLGGGKKFQGLEMRGRESLKGVVEGVIKFLRIVIKAKVFNISR